MRIAPEGWPFIKIGLVFEAGLLVLAWAFPGWFSTALAGLGVPFVVWLFVFFRDPERTGPRGDGLVISPADGRICSIARVDEPVYLHEQATRISVFMNVFDVHVNRYPASGEVEIVHYNPGEFLNAASEDAALVNESSSVGIRTPRGLLLVRQVAGLVARRIVTDCNPGDLATQGERMGMIRFGSRVDVFLAPGATVKVALGEHVVAGRTVLAELGA